ncbi:hypothetical protein pb186bvf_006444 [Paramecium bursaria]
MDLQNYFILQIEITSLLKINQIITQQTFQCMQINIISSNSIRHFKHLDKKHSNKCKKFEQQLKEVPTDDLNNFKNIFKVPSQTKSKT